MQKVTQNIHMLRLQRRAMCNVSALANITHLQYLNQVCESGCQYIEYVLGHDPAAIKAMKDSKLFWTWWHNQFAIIDSIFVEQLIKTYVHVCEYIINEDAEKTRIPHSVVCDVKPDMAYNAWLQNHSNNNSLGSIPNYIFLSLNQKRVIKIQL